MLQRSFSIDYLKFVLAVGVVLGHSILIHQVVQNWSFVLGAAFLRCVVPTFAVLSGYCFYVTCQRGKAGRWLAGLVIAYLFWTLFYVPIWYNSGMGGKEIARVFLFGTMHLWYIAGLLVAMPLIVGFTRLGKRTGAGLWPMLVLAAALAVTGSLLTYLDFFKVVPGAAVHTSNSLMIIFPFAASGYAIAAWVARNGFPRLPRASTLWMIVTLLFGAKLIEGVMDLRIFGLAMGTMPEIPLLALPAPVFLFLGFLRLELPELPVDLSGWSSSIYFLHIFVILSLRHFLGIDSVPVYLFVGVAVPIILAELMRWVKPVLLRLLGRRRGSVAHEGAA